MTLSRNYIELQDIDKTRLLSLIEDFKNARILVLGDLILDEFIIGYPSRISREAPILILKHLKTKHILGGGSNAANNIASLGGQADLIGVLGQDLNAEIFAELCSKSKINLYPIIVPHHMTTTKSRMISTSTNNPENGTVLQQQLLRIDKESKEDFNSSIYEQLNSLVKEKSSSCNIALISDYGNGVITPSTAQSLIQSGSQVVVDSNGDMNKFQSAYSMTPNQPDLEKFYGKTIQSEEDLISTALDCINKLTLKELLITRGAKGMLAINSKEANLVPAFNLSEVFDVTGAGDTVSAAYSLALAVGATALEAALIGNLAASIVVRKYGTATCSNEELASLIKDL